MRIYQSSMTIRHLREFAKRHPNLMPNILLSYALLANDLPHFLRRDRSLYRSIILDSGVFSLQKPGARQTPEELYPKFKTFTQYNPGAWDLIFNFDLHFGLDSYDKNLEYQIDLEQAGIPVVPVIHNIYNDDADKIIARCQTAPKVDPQSASNFDPLELNVMASPRGRGGGSLLASVLEPPAVVAGLDDLAVMRHPVQERRGHLGVAKDLAPLPEGQVSRHQDRRPFVELGEQVKQQLGAHAGKRQIAKLVEHDDIRSAQLVGQASALAGKLLLLQEIGQVHEVEEPGACPVSYRLAGDGYGQVRLAGARAADENDILASFQKASFIKGADVKFIDG